MTTRTMPRPSRPRPHDRGAHPAASRASGPADPRSLARPSGPARPPAADAPLGELDRLDADGQPAVVRVPMRSAFAGRQRWTRRWTCAVLVALDVLMLIAAIAIAYLARQSMPTLGHAGDLPEAIAEGSLIIGVGWIGAIALFGGYDVRLIASGPEIFRNILRASMGAAGIVGSVLFLTGVELSRVFFVALFLVGPVVLLANRWGTRRVVGWLRKRGRMRSRVLVVGSMPYIESIACTVEREQWLGYDVIGAVVPDGEVAASGHGIPVVGRQAELLDVVRAQQPAVIVFAAGSNASAEEFRRTAWQLEELDLDVIVVPALTEISSDRMSMRPVAGLPLVHLDLPRARDALKLSKRLFDIAASAVLLTLLAPVLAVVAILVKASGGGPVLFRQERVGRDGAPFTFLKFRSMDVDAESRLSGLRDGGTDRGNAVMFKMADDPRVTRFGRLLRRYSLDELPQLVNVLRGEMSIVGPRPALPIEMETYGRDAMRRLTVRPGITGLWQVSGRSDLSWEETVRLDLYYVDNWSFMQDAQIMIRTVKAVLSTSGAY